MPKRHQELAKGPERCVAAMGATDRRVIEDWAVQPGWIALSLVASVFLPVISLVIVLPAMHRAIRAHHLGAICAYGLCASLSLLSVAGYFLFQSVE
jgi:hypothetical protein